MRPANLHMPQFRYKELWRLQAQWLEVGSEVENPVSLLSDHLMRPVRREALGYLYSRGLKAWSP